MPTMAPVESGFPLIVAVIPPREPGGVGVGEIIVDVEVGKLDELTNDEVVVCMVDVGAILDDTDGASAKNWASV